MEFNFNRRDDLKYCRYLFTKRNVRYYCVLKQCGMCFPSCETCTFVITNCEGDRGK